MPDDPVIIVDASGTEHEFPSGFDPKKAAGIVRYRTQTHPPSAEDFAPQSETSAGSELLNALKNFGRAVNPVPIVQALADLQRGTLGGDFEAAQRTADRVKAMAGAQGQQFVKAANEIQQGRYSEAAGHGAAGLLPLVGPAAAAAGEQIGSGDVSGGLGSAAGLLANVESPRIVPPLARGAVKVAPTVGRGALTTAKTAAKVGIPLAIDAATTGLPIASGSAVAAMLAKPALRMVGRVIRDQLKAEAPAAETAVANTAATANPNAGGRMVRGGGMSAEQEMAAMLGDLQQELRAAPPEPGVQLPPPTTIAPSATPRTSAPALRGRTVPRETSAPTAAPTPSKRLYFLRDVPAKATAEPVTPKTGPLTLEDLPASWRSRIGTTPGEIPGAEGQAIADALKGFAGEQGIDVPEAIAAVSANPRLPVNIKLQLVAALKRGGA